MLGIAWSCCTRSGVETLAPGAKFVVARRMALPEEQQFTLERIDESAYLFVRLPFVSDPAIVLTATESQPVVYRGQRANGAIVELIGPSGQSSTPEPKQRFSLTASGSRIELRLPDLTVALDVEFDAAAVPGGSGTEQLGPVAW